MAADHDALDLKQPKQWLFFDKIKYYRRVVVTVQFKNISLMKNVALLCVVFAHCSMFFIEKNPFWMLFASEKSMFAIKAIFFMSYVIIPLFMFASGFLLAKSCEKAGGKLSGLFVKRVKRLLGPYLLTGLIWLVPLYTWFDIACYNRPAGTSLSGGYQAFLSGMFTDHLWFLLVLFWVDVFFILLFPLFRKSWLAGAGFSLAAVWLIQEFLQAFPYYKLDQTALPILSALFGILAYRARALAEPQRGGRQRIFAGALLVLVSLFLYYDRGNIYLGWAISIAGCLLFYFLSTMFVRTKIAAVIIYSRGYKWMEKQGMKYYLLHMPFPYLIFLGFYSRLHLSPLLFMLLNLAGTLAATTLVVWLLDRGNALWNRSRASKDVCCPER